MVAQIQIRMPVAKPGGFVGRHRLDRLPGEGTIAGQTRQQLAQGTQSRLAREAAQPTDDQIMLLIPQNDAAGIRKKFSEGVVF